MNGDHTVQTTEVDPLLAGAGLELSDDDLADIAGGVR